MTTLTHLPSRDTFLLIQVLPRKKTIWWRQLKTRKKKRKAAAHAKKHFVSRCIANVLHQIGFVEKNVHAYLVKIVQRIYKLLALIGTSQRTLTEEKPSLRKNTVTARNLIVSSAIVNAIVLGLDAHHLVNARTVKTGRQLAKKKNPQWDKISRREKRTIKWKLSLDKLMYFKVSMILINFVTDPCRLLDLWYIYKNYTLLYIFIEFIGNYDIER